MRKWRTKAAPDDPNAWADVSNMWPTPQGSYEVCDIYGSATSLTATGEGSQTGYSAWAFNVLSGTRGYVVGNKIWEYTALNTLTDRTGGITVSGTGYMAQYGNITLFARGTGNSLASSSGGNFSALGGSPSAAIVVVQSNAVVCFNTSVSSDGWASSDVGDYTNWSTGEAASGRILDHNGPITAAVPFGNDIIVFKADCIFRMTYVGGVVKWAIQKIVEGVGCYGSPMVTRAVNAAEACGDCILFLARPASQVPPAPQKAQIYRFDGVSAPRMINVDPETELLSPLICYDPMQRRAFLLDWNGIQVVPYYYALDTDSWGAGANLLSVIGTEPPIPVRGDPSAAQMFDAGTLPSTARPILVAVSNAFNIYRAANAGGSTTSSAYVKSSKFGRVDRKTSFKRLTPILRRRANNSSGGGPACSLTASFFHERHDTSAATTQNVTESTTRKRFDFIGTDNFANFKVTFTDMDAEIDDVLPAMSDAGTD